MKKINKNHLVLRCTHTTVSIIKLMFLTMLMLCLYTAAYTQPGTLDNRFGDKGRMLDSNFRGAADIISIQKNGKIVVAGKYRNGGGLHISRYNSDGSLDVGFGEEGRRILSFINSYHIGVTNNMVLQEDGKILVANPYKY